MGTRNLTMVCVSVDDRVEYKIAQYGQWDGYPAGQGKTVLDFLSGWDRAAFTEKVRACSFCTKEDFKAVQARIEAEDIPEWQRVWPELSRDTGAKILQMVHDNPPGMKLRNELDFAADSFFCEWAYVIDLAANKFEVYKGFNETPLSPNERFHFLEDKSEGGYHPIRLAMSYDLDHIPCLERMELDCESKDDED